MGAGVWQEGFCCGREPDVHSRLGLTASVKVATELGPALMKARALETPSLSVACVGIHSW